MMGKILHACLTLLLVLTGPLCHSQTQARVTDPVLEMVGNTIHISYNILNSSPDDTYAVSIEIKDEDGNLIRARALDGDIGQEITGGGGKEITWDLDADHVYLDAYVFVQIHASLVKHTPPVMTGPGEEQTYSPDNRPKEFKSEAEDRRESPPTEKLTRKEPAAHPGVHEFSRTGLVLQSLALPGLGLSRYTGKPHWLRGVAGYGCIAGSVIMRHSAVNTYDGIEDLLEFDEINRAYDKAVQQDVTSDILLFAAAGIWVADIVWTLVGTSGLPKSAYNGSSRGWSVGSGMDPVSAAPLISLRYKF
jgi:hypothetical protein